MARTTSTLTPDFIEDEVSIRGTNFRLRELSIGDYDDLVKKSTRTQSNPLTGDEQEMVDNALLLKLMVLKCVVEPKLSPESLSSLPMRVVLKLNQTVNRMHYGDEPETKKDLKVIDGGDSDEAAEGND